MPISTFVDYPGHQRPAQLCAISSSEMRLLFEHSLAQKRPSAVIVSHSFELLNSSRDRGNKIVVARFDRFCELLNALSPLGRTATFSELKNENLFAAPAITSDIRSNAWRTVSRMAEQGLGYIIYG